MLLGQIKALDLPMCQGLAKAGADIFNIGRREDDPEIRGTIEKRRREIPLLSC